MPVTSMRLRRFRGFEAAELELPRLTVLMGSNSAGKSSFSHALAALSHAHRSRSASLAYREEHAYPQPIDLGERIDTLRTTGTSGYVEVGLRTSAGWIDYLFGEGFELRGIRLPSPENALVETEQPSVGTSHDAVGGEYAVPSTSPILAAGEYHFSPDAGWRDSAGHHLIFQRDGLRVLAVNHPTGTGLMLAKPAQDDAAEFFEGFRYLKASRHSPRRGDRPRPLVTAFPTVGYRGELLPTLLQRDLEEPFKLRALFPRGEIDQGDLSWVQESGGLNELLGRWLDALGLASKVITRVKHHAIHVGVALDATGNERSLLDVGFGITQILPVLAEGLLMPADATLAVDLPEAHLQPRPQWLLADYFCSLVKLGKRVIVETHSPALFHRFRLWAEADDELSSEIAVYFLDGLRPTGRCESPRRIGLSAEAEIQWPPGFLAEGLDTEMGLMRLRNQKADGEPNEPSSR